jgi:hypothetical protein
MTCIFTMKSIGPGESHAFAREVIKASREGLSWTTPHPNSFAYEATLPDGRRLSFCARHPGDRQGKSPRRTTLTVVDKTGPEHSTLYLDLSRADTRALINSVCGPQHKPRDAALRPITSDRPHCRRHHFLELSRREQSSPGGVAQLAIVQRCECGCEREVVRRPAFGGLLTRTVAITVTRLSAQDAAPTGRSD